MAISNKKAFEAAKVVVEYCAEQKNFQNCIFRKFGAEHWKCHIQAMEIQEIVGNINAKKKNHGFI